MNNQINAENSEKNDPKEDKIDVFNIFPINPFNPIISKTELLSIALDKGKSKLLLQKLRKSYGLAEKKIDNVRFNLLQAIFPGHFKKNLGEVLFQIRNI